MKILVALKQVPDTETKIKINSQGTALDLSDVKWVTSPYDEYALEEAMRLKESQGATVSVIAVGDDRVRDVLRNALALGADEALHVSTSEKCEDPFVVATYLVNAVRDRGFDLLFFGNKGSGGDHAAVGPMVAELLGIAQANVVVKLTLEQGRFIAERQVESGLEVVEGNLPAVITTQKGLNDPRYPNLKGIMAAKKKEIMALPLTEPLSPSLQTLKLTLPPPRAEGRQLSGTPQEQAQALFAALQNEAKIF
ncbi:electron transfer flavoprotein subunit beta [Acidobacteriota bacterium]|nr:electron transfer flavoprotein subunit beta [Acidobacteriota bacterium]